MTDGLTDKDRVGIRSVLKASPKVRRALLFGSRAIGTFRGASDVDLALEGDDIRLQDLIAIRAHIGKLNLPIEVDLIVRAKIDNPELEQHIKKYGRQWYQQKQGDSGTADGARETLLAAVMDVKHGFAFPGESIHDEPPGDILLTPGNFAVGGGFKGDKFKYFRGPVPEDYVLNEGDLLVTMTDLSKQADTLGYPALVPKPQGARFLHNQRLGKVLIKPEAELDIAFLFYLLCSAGYRNEILASATGTTVKHTSPTRILSYKVLLPPISRQKTIAQILGTLDHRIELNRRMNSTLEAMARALFQSWFVDFDPVRARLDGRRPTGLDPTAAAFFPSNFQNSPIGPIPQDWEIGSILKQANLLSGGTPKTSVPDYWDGDIAWASAKDVSQCGEAFLISTERSITKRGLEESSTKIIPAYSTVVVARGATTGRLAMFGEAMAMNQTCYGLESKSDTPFALYCHARHFIDRIVHAAHGSIFDTITTQTFETTDVLLAPINVLRAFDKQVSPLFHQIRANLHQSRTLATLRDTLLPKLLDGEMDVNTAGVPTEGSS